MRVNVWIRKENEQVWQDMTNKSEWLNEMLVRETTPLKAMPRISKPVTEALKDVETLEPDFTTPRRVLENLPKPTAYCEHGQLKGQCLQKKCKYGRGA